MTQHSLNGSSGVKHALHPLFPAPQTFGMSDPRGRAVWPEGRPHELPVPSEMPLTVICGHRVNPRSQSLAPASGEPLPPGSPAPEVQANKGTNCRTERSQGEEECRGGMFEKTLFLFTAREGRWRDMSRCHIKDSDRQPRDNAEIPPLTAARPQLERH